MASTWTFHSAAGIHFGPGAVEQLGPLAAKHGASKVMIVTDATLAAAGIVDRVTAPLDKTIPNIEVFTGGQPEPSLDLIEQCVAQACAAEPDAIIAIGGGSNIDLAKVTALRFTHGGSTRDYLGEDQVPGPIMPVFCLPTTAGSGSEVTGSAVLTDTENQIKVAILSNFLRPRVALIDPQLTISCPPKVTADSGIDALVHAIEAYTAVDHTDLQIAQGEQPVFPGRNPMGDMVAAQCIQLVGRHLADAVARPNDLPAREGMALAATLGGLAFSNVCVALVHAMEYPLGGLVHCSHGQGNGLLLPYVMRFNLPTRIPEFARVAQWLGESTGGQPDSDAAQHAVTAVEKLNARIGIPKSMSEIGVKASDIPVLAEKAFGIKRLMRLNPRTVALNDIVNIYQQAL
ncbi:MAG: alcohol dehydrogenase [Planctomycetaceae bacterium]|nr:alcohol dehydrogenase [Planctomycetaceae bacterium]